MARFRLGTGLAGLLLLAALGAAAARPAPEGAAAPAAGAKATLSAAEREQFFAREIRPLLEAKCVACHSGEQPQGGLRLTTREALLKGGLGGASVSPAKPAESLLLKAVNYDGRRMPPQGKLPQEQIDLLTRWVAMGLPWPGGQHASLEPKQAHAVPQVNDETRRYWAFQPVKRPAVPAVAARWRASMGSMGSMGSPGRTTSHTPHTPHTLPATPREWVRNPIDAFILQGLEEAGLAPNPPASRETLIRRANYDLLGLPPSPEEVRAFAADESPDAWEKLVDRLLAAPQYGEKWGRHWLDLVRFAESNSYERDGDKPNAWRYRDYVIRSFNEDKPYDQFIIEQLAGDELAPRTPERLIATGYHRLGIWDDEPADPKQALYDDLDDIAGTTAQVFLGMTIGCARCHDHKIEPIPQADYYRFLAFFSGVQRYGVRSEESVEAASLRPIAPEQEVRKFQAEIAAHREKIRKTSGAIEAIERKVLPDLEPVEKEEWQTPTARPAILKKRVPRLLTQAEYDGYLALQRERRELFRSRPRGLEMALCVTEVGPKARETHVLARGNPHTPGEKVEPGFPSVLSPPAPQIAPGPHGDTSGRRLALARWIASAENPLTARVMANRVWQYHFGRGIVRSTNQFGLGGDAPTHPELLDWLAAEFVEGMGSMGSMGSGVRTSHTSHTPHTPHTPEPRPWSLKRLHRLIMTSNAYRMSSAGRAAALAKDPENDRFWRYDMRRLTAEEVRDSVLAANGSLDLKMGGPSFYPTLPAEVLAGQSRPGENWHTSPAEEQRRRSVYIFVKRSLQVPVIASFDGADTDFTCPVRFTTTQPTQALGMLNSAWTNEQAQVFAEYLRKQAGEGTAAQVELALRRVFQRAPKPAEVERGVALIESLRKDEGMSPERALQAFCVVALNLNEFIYLD